MSLEANKIAAAVLVGGLLTLSVGIATHMIYGTPSGSTIAESPSEPSPVELLVSTAGWTLVAGGPATTR